MMEGDRIVFLPEAVCVSGLSRPELHHREAAGEFPARVSLGPSTGWLLSDINRWLRERPEADARQHGRYVMPQGGLTPIRAA